ncbi:MAG: DpnI domain-containing protein [Albidovulum sp.]
MHGEDDEFSPGLGFEEAPTHFQSPSQKARIWTEGWVRNSLYCPNCGEPRFRQFTNNRPVADFYCGACGEEFELKSQKGRFGAKVVDGAYRTMRERVAARNNPNLILLNYDLATQGVTNVLVVPRHFFVDEIIEPRKPLAPTARRAGWVGCNILLNRIPEAGRIYLLRDRLPVPKPTVRALWDQTVFLRDTLPSRRGWLLEVMSCVEALGRRDFTLTDVYASEPQLQALFPGNSNVRPKIRQQLQALRDNGFIEFLGRGRYRLTSPPHA